MDLIVKHRSREAEVKLEKDGRSYRVVVDGTAYDVDFVATDGSVLSLIVDGRQFLMTLKRRGGGRYWVGDGTTGGEVELMDPLTHLAMQSHAGAVGGTHQVTAYMPGRVVELLVQEGDVVEAGQGLVVLEAMKMENEIRAEHAGVVEKVRVEAGQAVEGGDVLFEIAAGE